MLRQGEVQVVHAFRAGHDAADAGSPDAQLLPGDGTAGRVLRTLISETRARFVVVVLEDRAAQDSAWIAQAVNSLENGVAACTLVEHSTVAITYPMRAVALRTDIVRQLAGLATTLQPLGQMMDIVWRARSAGYVVHQIESSTPGKSFTELIGTDEVFLHLVLRNLETWTLSSILPRIVLAQSASATRRSDISILDLQRSSSGDEVLTSSVDGLVAQWLGGMSLMLAQMPDLEVSRTRIDAMRRVADVFLLSAIAEFIEQSANALGWSLPSLDAQAFGSQTLNRSPHVLVITQVDASDTATSKQKQAMASASYEVRLLVSEGAVPAALSSSLEWADVVVLDGVPVRDVPGLVSSKLPVGVDLTDWVLVRDLDREMPFTGGVNPSRYRGDRAESLAETLERADHVWISTEAQRDYVLGFMGALGRITPQIYDEDSRFANLVSPVAADWEDWLRAPRRSVDHVQTMLPTPVERTVKSQFRRIVRRAR